MSLSRERYDELRNSFAVFCETCFKPGRITDRGYFCDEHYVDAAPVCEMCGERVAVIREHGYVVCLQGRCLAKARGQE